MSIKKQLPNVASGTRIVGSLLLPFLMWESWGVTITVPILGTFPGVPLVWVIAFLLLVLTDKLDGTLARKLKAESELGATLDAIGDILILVIGIFCVLLHLARGALTTAEFWLDIAIVALILGTKVVVFFVSAKYHGTANALHSIPHKAWAVLAYVMVSIWAFTRDVQLWLLVILLLGMIYAVVDEIIYIMRTATYDVDFKGHGFEKYALKKDLADTEAEDRDAEDFAALGLSVGDSTEG